MDYIKPKTKEICFPIGVLSELGEVNQGTLRIYDKEGILCPKRSDKNRRLYTQKDLEKLNFILYLSRNLAINLAGIKIILKMLEKTKTEPKNYIKYVNEIALLTKIDSEIQKENIIKHSKKGRNSKKAAM